MRLTGLTDYVPAALDHLFAHLHLPTCESMAPRLTCPKYTRVQVHNNPFHHPNPHSYQLRHSHSNPHIPTNTIPVPTLPQLAPLSRNSKARWPKRVSVNAFYRILSTFLSLFAVVLFIALAIRNSRALGIDSKTTSSTISRLSATLSSASAAVPAIEVADHVPSKQVQRRQRANDPPSLFSVRPFKLAYPDADNNGTDSINNINTARHQEHDDANHSKSELPSTLPHQPEHLSTATHPEAATTTTPSGGQDVGFDKESVSADFTRVITDFMNTAPLASFNRTAISTHYHQDHNNMHKTSMLVNIRNGVANFTHQFHESQHGRAESIKYIINKIIDDRAAEGLPKLLDVTFIVMVSDGHGAKLATFGSARHWRHWVNLMPVPMGNRRGMALGWGTMLKDWDAYVDMFVTRTHANYTWESKIEKAFFRGTLSMQTYRLGSCNFENGHMCQIARNWTQINRGVLWIQSQKAPHLFDVGFTSVRKKSNSPPDSMVDSPKPMDGIKFVDYQKYKYLINVGNNQDWAERLRNLLFTNSAVIMHEAETQEFFMPLLRPWVHYIPTNLMMTDLVDHVKWAKANDAKVRQIVRQQHAFARRYISEKAMQLYWDISINEFAIRQRQATETKKK